jgi:hypothetical protein
MFYFSLQMKPAALTSAYALQLACPLLYGLTLSPLLGAVHTPLTPSKTIILEHVAGRIDHMAADVPGQRLFVAALGNDTVEVLDLKASRSVRSLAGFAEPQGIAYVPELNRLFVANGRDGTCRILDARTFKAVETVRLGEDADNVRYDAKAKRIYVGFGRGALAVLNPRSGVQTANIKLTGHPESFQLEPSGNRLFVNVPQAGHIAVVERASEKVVATWGLIDAASNFPLALDPLDERLFIGCRSPARLLVYAYKGPRGWLVASYPIAGDTDDLFWDRSNRMLYVSCGQGTLLVIRQITPDSYRTVQTIPTAPGARTSLFIPELRSFCLAVPRRGDRSAEVRVFETR